MTSIAAMVVLQDDGGRVLLVRHGYGRRHWSLPGGSVEPQEAPWEAAVREAREEVAVDVEIDALVAVYHLAPEPFGLRFVFAGRTSDEPAPQPDEIVEVGWFEGTALPHHASATLRFAVCDAVAGARGLTRRVVRTY